LQKRFSLIALTLIGFVSTGFSYTGEHSSSLPQVMRAPDWNEQQAAEWDSAKEKVARIEQEKLEYNQLCRQTWDIVWPLAKAGNLEARFSVFTAFRDQNRLAYTTDLLHVISMPAIRTYLYYHSLGAPRLSAEIARMLERIKANPKLIDEYPEQDALKKYPKIQACVWEHPSQACTEMLGASSPTYERITEELDMLIKAGVGVPCISVDGYRSNNPNLLQPVPNPYYQAK